MIRQGEAADPSDFVKLLERFKHPRLASIGVESTIYGNNPRKEVGIAPHGTIWVAQAGVYYNGSQWLEDHTYERGWTIAIPRFSIPYKSIRTAQWNEEKSRWEKGDITRGWSGAVEDLLQQGYLRDHPFLSLLIRQNTRKLARGFAI